MTSVTVTCAGIVREFGEKLRLRAITVRVTGSSDAGVDVGSVGAGWRIVAGGCEATVAAVAVGSGVGTTVARGVSVATTEVAGASAYGVGDGAARSPLPLHATRVRVATRRLRQPVAGRYAREGAGAGPLVPQLLRSPDGTRS